MKVPVTILIDVDTQAFRDEYGTMDTADEVREFMRQHVMSAAERGANAFLRSPSNPRGYVRSMRLRGAR